MTIYSLGNGSYKESGENLSSIKKNVTRKSVNLTTLHVLSFYACNITELCSKFYWT